ncbi:hypothetical protein B9Z19DRAFT_716597 [Tuber borchii]|uniref:Uncharacterized protein n=1 Tax=Tuber borchii TaxID=42251 RepID=A0A2T6ZYM7_TUBBO|nr:hypothetical protein B9Z19DRAFT_716597 [Tuber borchii]
MWRLRVLVYPPLGSQKIGWLSAKAYSYRGRNFLNSRRRLYPFLHQKVDLVKKLQRQAPLFETNQPSIKSIPVERPSLAFSLISEIWKFGNLPLGEATAELYQISIPHHPSFGSTLKAVHTTPERDLVIGEGLCMIGGLYGWKVGMAGLSLVC